MVAFLVDKCIVWTLHLVIVVLVFVVCDLVISLCCVLLDKCIVWALHLVVVVVVVALLLFMLFSLLLLLSMNALYGHCICRRCRTTFVFYLGCVLLSVCLQSCKLDVELVGLIIACNQSAQRKHDVARFVYAYVIWLFF